MEQQITAILVRLAKHARHWAKQYRKAISLLEEERAKRRGLPTLSLQMAHEAVEKIGYAHASAFNALSMAKTVVNRKTSRFLWQEKN